MVTGIMTDWRIIYGDCLQVMPSLPDSSVGLICTDPPYYRVKNEPWDRQWDSPEGFLEWFGLLCAEWQRVLKPNGSLYVFASPKMAARVECKVSEFFEVLNRIVWRKHDGTYNEGGLWSRADKDILRRYFEQKEEIVFAEHCGADNMAKGEAGYGAKCDEVARSVFGAYITAIRNEYGLTMKELTAAIGAHGAVNHGGACSNWESGYNLPTREQYNRLRIAFPGCFGRDHEDLEAEYETLRAEYESLRRPFAVTADVPYTDVWDFPTVKPYAGKHPCEKPEALLSHIIKTSSRLGDIVLDCFTGSGSAGCAAVKHGREFIGIELSEHWCQRSEERIRETENPAQLTLEEQPE